MHILLQRAIFQANEYTSGRERVDCEGPQREMREAGQSLQNSWGESQMFLLKVVH